MTSSSSLEQSRQGSTTAIAALINRHLQPKGITAKVALKNQCLMVLLESAAVPDQQIMGAFVLKGIRSLNLAAIESLQVYGKQSNEKSPRWQQTYRLQLDILAAPASKATPTPRTGLAQPQPDVKLSETTVPDMDAIAAHLSETLGNDEITFKVSQSETLLKVIVLTNQFLDGPAFAAKVCKEIKSLNVSELETLEVHKQKLKGAHIFQIKAFTLVQAADTAPQTASSPEDESASEAQTSQRHPCPAQLTTNSQLKKKRKLKIGRIMAIVFIVLVAGFVLSRLLRQLVGTFLLSPVFGGFSVIMALFFLWRASAALNPLLQWFLHLLAEED